MPTSIGAAIFFEMPAVILDFRRALYLHLWLAVIAYRSFQFPSIFTRQRVAVFQFNAPTERSPQSNAAPKAPRPRVASFSVQEDKMTSGLRTFTDPHHGG
jgi:hypothetical protein